MGRHESDDQVDEKFLRQQALGLAKLEELAAQQAEQARQAEQAEQLRRRPDGRITND
jgi:hypothetical protein